MASMAHTVLSAGVLTDTSKLSNLIDAIKQSVTIDQGWDIFSFAQQMQSMTGGNIQFQTIPIVTETYPTKSDGDAVEVNPTQVQQFVASTIRRRAAAPPRQRPRRRPLRPTNASSGGSANNAKVTAEVLNGSGKTGLASKVLNVLTGKGFKAGGTGNTAAAHHVRRRVRLGRLGGRPAVAAALGGLTTESSSSLPAGAVRVLIGTKYNGPTSDTAASSGGSTSSGGPWRWQLDRDLVLARRARRRPSRADGVTCVD